MARTKQQIEADKRAIKAGLAKIVEGFNEVEAEMASLPHQEMRTSHQSLDKKTGQYITHYKNSIIFDYIHTDGKRYFTTIGRS